MNTQELDILDIVAKDPETSQRKIAQKMGISLGQVNFLLKKFVSIGLVKIEGQTAKSMQYHLTPKGMATLAEKTMRYMRKSYIAVRAMSEKVMTLGSSYADRGFDIYLAGAKDEIMEITALALKEGKIPYQVGLPAANDGAGSGEKAGKTVVFYWEDQHLGPASDTPADRLEAAEKVNILEGLDL